MTRLTWGPEETVRYQLGIDRGVLFPKDRPAVAWSGLISVNEDAEGGNRTAFYHDGEKYAESVSSTLYKSSIRAYSAPPEFLECVGEVEVVPGFTLTAQPYKPFDLCYRTMVGDSRYKLHYIYNAIAVSSAKKNATQGRGSSIVQLEWKITAAPPIPGDFAPTAHFIVDSTEVDPSLIDILEAYTYGNDVSDPEMPDLSVLISVLNMTNRTRMSSPHLMSSKTLTSQA